MFTFFNSGPLTDISENQDEPFGFTKAKNTGIIFAKNPKHHKLFYVTV
jgi:hypothetical protein